LALDVARPGAWHLRPRQEQAALQAGGIHGDGSTLIRIAGRWLGSIVDVAVPVNTGQESREFGDHREALGSIGSGIAHARGWLGRVYVQGRRFSGTGR
jgi:hypothetical protein